MGTLKKLLPFFRSWLFSPHIEFKKTRSYCVGLRCEKIYIFPNMVMQYTVLFEIWCKFRFSKRLWFKISRHIEFKKTRSYCVGLRCEKIYIFFQIWSCYIQFYPKFDVDSDFPKDHDLKMSYSKSISLSVKTMMS